MKRTSRKRAFFMFLTVAALGTGISVALAWPPADEPVNTLTGSAAFATVATEKPGTFRKITADDLPAPFSSPSVANQSRIIARPANASLQVPPGFQIALFATGFDQPRNCARLPMATFFWPIAVRAKSKCCTE
jgi:hypothetical protein